MPTITFDTQEAVIKLKSIGVSQEHADAFVRVIVEAQNSLATKDDIKSTLEAELAPVKVDLAVLKAEATFNKWMLGFLLAGMLSIIVKTFF